LVPLNQRADIEKVSMERPSEDEVKETTEKTREALEKIVQGKSSVNMTSLVENKFFIYYIFMIPRQNKSGTA
jgi:hypothetical protein